MRTNCYILALAAAFGIFGVTKAMAQAQIYGSPYDCVYYYMCVPGYSCTAGNNTCGPNNNPYNHFVVQAQGLGYCLVQDGAGCIYFNGNATCWVGMYYNDPPGVECSSDDLECSIPSNTATGCEANP